jgi:hypothetical protein
MADAAAMRKLLLAACAVGLAAACSTPPPIALASPAQDAVGKQFGPPPPGMATVYFYNPTNFGPAINLTVGPAVIGSLAPTSYMRVELNAGAYSLGCTTVGTSNTASITVAPGQIRFIDVKMPPAAPACSLREAAPDTGRAGVLAAARVMQTQ